MPSFKEFISIAQRSGLYQMSIESFGKTEAMHDFKTTYNEIKADLEFTGCSATAYRALDIDSLKDIDYENLGVHWTLDEDKANAEYGQVVLSAQINRDDVEIVQTIIERLECPEEEEIQLKIGRNIKITGYKKTQKSVWKKIERTGIT